MAKGFDIAAINYDHTFTNTSIGKYQRNLVYTYLKSTLTENSSNILEINCGTGEDAIWLSKLGHSVLATDISEGMINVAKQKVNHQNHDNLSFSILDINNINETTFNHKFDMVFSNFGGLNCLNEAELKSFFNTISKHLNPNGKLGLVIMSKHCLWEQFYFFIKGKWNSVFRRSTSDVIFANVDGVTIPTWYYNPKQIVNKTAHLFKINAIRPVGFFIPPSYLDPFFKNKNRILRQLFRFEKRIKNISWLAKYADHYIIELQLK